MQSILLFPQQKFIVIFAVTFLGMLLLLYVFQINFLTEMAYRIAEYQENIQQLKDGTKTLEARYTKTFSFRNLEDIATQLNFEKIRTVTYIKILEGSVARTTNSQ